MSGGLPKAGKIGVAFLVTPEGPAKALVDRLVRVGVTAILISLRYN